MKRDRGDANIGKEMRSDLPLSVRYPDSKAMNILKAVALYLHPNGAGRTLTLRGNMGLQYFLDLVCEARPNVTYITCNYFIDVMHE